MGWELPEMSSSSSFVPAFQITCLSQFTILTTFPFHIYHLLGACGYISFFVWIKRVLVPQNNLGAHQTDSFQMRQNLKINSN